MHQQMRHALQSSTPKHLHQAQTADVWPCLQLHPVDDDSRVQLRGRITPLHSQASSAWQGALEENAIVLMAMKHVSQKKIQSADLLTLSECPLSLLVSLQCFSLDTVLGLW